MNIIQENGKDYLETFFAKIDNYKIDCTPLFMEVEECLQQILKNYNKENKTKLTFLHEDMYGYPLQALLNRFSGNYFSPSFLKSYQDNPATCFYSMFCEEENISATSIGTTFHSIMEEFFKSDNRTVDSLYEIKNKLVLPGQEDKIDSYIRGFLNTKDYLTNNLQEFNINCICEYKGKGKLYIPKFDTLLPTCAYVIDRIDFRGEDIYIVDYKTGSVTDKNLTFSGNLAQMIIYKWVIEQKFKTGVRDVYICSPGNERYMKCDCSEENQKILLDEIQQFFMNFKKDNLRRVYRYTDKGYFTNSQLQQFREIMNDNSIRMAKIPVKICLN